MTQDTQTSQPGILGGGNMNIQQMYEAGLHLVQGICSIVAMPLESALRPQFGTRYFNPVTTLMACLMMLLLGALGALGGHESPAFGRHLPDASHQGFISLAMLAALFFIGNAIHGPRLYRRMLHPELERHSEYEGSSLPVLRQLFALLPYGAHHWPVRIVYEPLTGFAATTALSVFGILQRPAVLYLITAAVLLSVKCFIEWYRAWLYIRILLDGQAAAPIIASVARGTATEEEMAQVHLAGIPRSVPPEIKAAAIAQRTAGLPAAIASLVSPVDTPQAA